MNEEDLVLEQQYDWWHAFLERGPVYIGCYVLFIITVLVGTIMIRRKAPLPWLFFASLTPLLASMLAGHVATMSYFGFMSFPDLEGSRRFFLPEIRFFWIGFLTSVAMTITGYYRLRSTPLSPTPSGG